MPFPFLSVNAASTLIQQNNNGATSPAVVAVTLPNNVASGDVLVVGLAIYPGWSSMSVSDSLGSSFTQAVTVGTGDTYSGSIYTATLSSSGPDTVTAQITALNPTPFDAYVYEVAGVSTAGLATGTGSGAVYAPSTSSVSFQPGAFLFGIIVDDFGGPVTAGAGFTLSTENSGFGFSNG